MSVFIKGEKMKTKSKPNGFLYSVGFISAMVGLLLATQISASAAATNNGLTAKKVEKFVVTVIAGGFGVVTTAAVAGPGASLGGIFVAGMAGTSATTAAKLAGDYAVDHPAKAVAKTAPVVAAIYLPVFPGVGTVLMGVGVTKSAVNWFKK